MKKITLILAFVVNLISAHGQTDEHGNPVFNSEQISIEQFDGFELTSIYYTIDSNIANKASSVYFTDEPTLSDYLKFATELPSYAFLVHRNQVILLTIMLMQEVEDSKATFTYRLHIPESGKSFEVPCGWFGDVTEKRAEELIELKVDTTAEFMNLPNDWKGLLINKVIYRIQPYDKVKEEVVLLVQQFFAQSGETDNVVNYIESESIDGKLDFGKVLENEEQSLFLIDGVAYNKKDYAILLWGIAVKKLGVKSSKEALNLWEGINKRSLTGNEKKALVNGFNKQTN